MLSCIYRLTEHKESLYLLHTTGRISENKRLLTLPVPLFHSFICTFFRPKYYVFPVVPSVSDTNSNTAAMLAVLPILSQHPVECGHQRILLGSHCPISSAAFNIRTPRKLANKHSPSYWILLVSRCAASPKLKSTTPVRLSN